MKRLLFIFTLFCVLVGTMSAQDDKVLPAYNLAGNYYTKDFASKAHDYMGQGISAIKDHEGNRMILLLAQVGELGADIKAMEIPKDKVKNLEDWEEQIELMTSMIQATHAKLSANSELKVNRALPGTFNLKDLEGKTWTKANLKNKVTVINVWYSGCGPCIKEMPILSEWKNQNPDVLFLSANYQTPETAKKVVDKAGFNWNHLVNDNYFTKWVGNLGYPLTIVLDKNGIVRKIVHGTNEVMRNDILKTFQTLK